MKKASHSYDQETDTLYVSFGTGEPSYAKEVDDVLLLELGIYSNMPTGFRIVGFKKQVSRVDIEFKLIKKMETNLKAAVLQQFAERSKALENQLHTIASA